MTVINTNTAATLTANALAKNERAMNQTMERLSTGQRINSAADDAAGLAISSKMTSQINGLNMAVRNANDAISMIQTADGAMIEVTNMLQRMRELAVQAASDTNTSADRASLNVEFQALGAEITRIGGNTQWNGVNILDGAATSGAQDFQVGANANQVIQHTFATIGKNSSTISQADTTAGTGGNAQVTTLTIAGTADGDVVTGTINGQAFALTLTDHDGAAGAGMVITTGATDGAVAIVEAKASGTTITMTAGAVDDPFVIENLRVGNGIGAAVGGLDLTTKALATAAITAVNTQITTLNTSRSAAGASINRLEFAADNLSNVSQNASASRSRILDADYAAETTELARTQIIQQAGTAMLSQANQQAQSVLALLK